MLCVSERYTDSTVETILHIDSSDSILECNADSIAKKLVETLLSELPEEFQTGEAAKFILSKARKIIESAKIKL